ncbi:unnamed protein product, partial [marine sediment metagenome]
MALVEPDRYSVNLLYVCKKCEYEHEVDPEETQFPGGVRCTCGEKIKFKAITNVTVSPIYGTEDVTTSDPMPTALHDDAVDALIGIGFGKPKAVEFVSTHSHFTSIEEFVREA